MLLPGAAASVIKRIAWLERGETGAAGGSTAKRRGGNLQLPPLGLFSALTSRNLGKSKGENATWGCTEWNFHMPWGRERRVWEEEEVA